MQTMIRWRVSDTHHICCIVIPTLRLVPLPLVASLRLSVGLLRFNLFEVERLVVIALSLYCHLVIASVQPRFGPVSASFLPRFWTGPALVVVRLLSACCPLDVRLLSALKADNKRTSSGQQADNRQQPVLVGGKMGGGVAVAMGHCGRLGTFVLFFFGGGAIKTHRRRYDTYE